MAAREREEGWRAELIETLPDGTRRFRLVKPPKPPKQRRRVIADCKPRFLELYDQGLYDREIGDALGFHRHNIGNFRRKLGLPPNRTAESKIDEVEFLKLYRQRISDHKIAKAFGVSHSAVGSYRRRRGLPAHFTFIKPSLTDDEKRRIRELHTEGLPITRIAEEISRSPRAIHDFCGAEGLDTSASRGRGYRRRLRRAELLDYLGEHGPTPQVILSKELGIGMGHFTKIAREMFGQVERFTFRVGQGRGGTKYGGTGIYGELGEMNPVFAVRDDPRIVGFVADRVPFKVETSADARTLVSHLKKQLGYERAREVVKRLGYQYQRTTHKAERVSRPRPTGFTPRPKKFTDEQFRELYDKDLNDVEIGKILGASTSAVGQRRRRLRLPAIGKRGRKRRFGALDMLRQMEARGE